MAAVKSPLFDRTARSRRAIELSRSFRANSPVTFDFTSFVRRDEILSAKRVVDVTRMAKRRINQACDDTFGDTDGHALASRERNFRRVTPVQRPCASVTNRGATREKAVEIRTQCHGFFTCKSFKHRVRNKCDA